MILIFAILAWLAVKRLISEHGREKCDAMFEELLRREKLVK